MSDRISLIVAAAGYARRFGEDKIFKPLLGRPLLEWSLRPFLEFPEIGEIVLVLRSEALDQARFLFKAEKIAAIVAGGETREHSVFKGLEEVHNSRFVLVHDGDRPCLTSLLVKRVLEELKEHPAVLPVLPVKETIKALTGEMQVKETLGKGYWLAQTPQGFKYQTLKEAFSKAENAFQAPDDAYIVEKAGIPVKAILGEETNIKVTTPFDFRVAEMILRERDFV